jgi:Fe-S-cluster containining protein
VCGSANKNGSQSQELCLACGLCCNGVIFADVKLMPGDNAARLQSLGMPLLKSILTRSKVVAGSNEDDQWRFKQPCSAFNGCRCRIYPSRPKYCREFDCLLLKKVQEGTMTQSGALRIIQAARRRVRKVQQLLIALGDTDETIALAERFRRITRRLRRLGSDAQTAEIYGRLTLAFHKLSLTLNRSFYSPSSSPERIANRSKEE